MEKNKKGRRPSQFEKAFSELERAAIGAILPIQRKIKEKQYGYSFPFEPILSAKTQEISLGRKTFYKVSPHFEGGNEITALLRVNGLAKNPFEIYRVEARYYPDAKAREEGREKIFCVVKEDDFIFPEITIGKPIKIEGEPKIIRRKKIFSNAERKGMIPALCIHKASTGKDGFRLLSYTGQEIDCGSDKAMIFSYNFEEGVEIKIFLYNMDRLTQSCWAPIEDWVIFRADIQYRQGFEEIKKSLSKDDLLKIKNDPATCWHAPRVDASEICGGVGVFVDNAAGEGYIEVDPQYNQEGHSTMYDSVSYSVLVEGDLERAKKEAQKKLDGYLTVNAVAVFSNRPAGEAYYKDNPSGNYKGSGKHPFSFETEFPYDPNIEGDRERAMVEAKKFAASLL